MSSPRAKRFDQHGILGEMREDAQLDLRIIGGEQSVARLGDECGANLAAQLRCAREYFADSGFEELRRPVAVPVWLKLRVQAARCAGESSCGSASA